MKSTFSKSLAALAVSLLLPSVAALGVSTNFYASFQTANGTNNATTNVLNSGTAVGTWNLVGLPAGASGVGAISSNAANRVYVMAHNNGTIAGIATQPVTNWFADTGTYPTTYPYDATLTTTRAIANLQTAGAFTGSAQTLVNFKWGSFGTDNPRNTKGQFMRGLDASGKEVFKLLWVASSVGSTRLLYYRTPSQTNITVNSSTTATPDGTAITVGAGGNSWSSTTVNTDPAEYIQVSALLTNATVTFTVTHSQFTNSPLTSSAFPIDPTVTSLARLEFSMMWCSNTVNTQNKGFWVDDILVTDGPLPNPKSYLWKGNLSSTWDVGATSNWVDTATSFASTFTQNNNGGTTAIFDDTATTGNVSITPTVLPTIVLFSNATTAYSLSGAGKISGSGVSVNFNGAGIVTMSNANDYSGVSTINAGRVRLGNDFGLGSGSIVISSGTLSSVGSAARTPAAAMSINGNIGLGDATDNGLLTFSNQIATGTAARTVTNYSDVRFAAGVQGGSGGITKKYGDGTLTLNGAVNMTGSLDIFQGSLVLDGASYTNNARLRPSSLTATTVARLALTNGATVYLNATNVNLACGNSIDSLGTNIIDLGGLFLMNYPGASSGKVLLENLNSLYSEVNFNVGGDFTARSVETTGGGSNPTRLNFNGGTLRAVTNNSAFFQGLTETYVRSGGARISDNGFNITINQDLLDGGGSGGLTKLGAGTLTLNSSNNTYTGSTVVSNGTLNLRIPFGSSSLVASTGTTVGFVVGKSATATKSLSGLTLAGTNTLQFIYDTNSVAPAGAVVSVASIASSGDINVSISGAWPVGTHTLFDYSGASPSFVLGNLPMGVVGYLTNDLSDTSIKLVITFSAGAKTWFGNNGSGVNGGLWDIATTANWDAGASQYNETGSFGDFVTFDSAVSPNYNVQVTMTVQPVGVLVTNIIGGASDFAFFGPGKISGAGALTKWLGGNLTLNMTNDYSGGTFIRQGNIVLNVNNALPVNGLVTIGSAGTTASLLLNGFNQTVGGLLSGGSGLGFRQVQNSNAISATLTINSTTGSSNVYSHTLGSTSASTPDNLNIIKNGSGEQRVSICNYSGLTTINAGRYIFTGNAIGMTNTVTVNSGGTIGGTGTIGGEVVLNSGATLSPANNQNAIGALVLSKNLTMAAGATNWFDLNAASGNADAVTNLANVSYAGTLVVTNVSNTAFTGTQTFPLFYATGTKSGNFSSVVVLPNTGATGSFDPSTGVLTISTVPTASTNLTMSVSGSTLTLSWPANYLGWKLQVQTNSLNAGLGTNWVTIPGTEAVTSTNLPIIPGNPSVFYRMVYP